jgi:hypothetical protein
MAVEAVHDRVKPRRQLRVFLAFPGYLKRASTAATDRLGKILAGSAMSSGDLPEGL